MSESPFTTQFLRHRDGDSVIVTAERTVCPHLVITPAVGRDPESDVHRLTGGLALTHTLTGLAVAHGNNGDSLHTAAERLHVCSWDFTDTDHFRDPKNADEYKQVRLVLRQWYLDDALGRPTEWETNPKMTDAERAARAAAPARELLVEHLDWWMRCDKDRPRLPADRDDKQGFELWGSSITTSVEAFGVCYLLAVLHTLDPMVADIAARDLMGQWEAGDSLGEWVWQWRDELAKSKPLTLPGIPASGSPLDTPA